jgi:hypothetical protein
MSSCSASAAASRRPASPAAGGALNVFHYEQATAGTSRRWPRRCVGASSCKGPETVRLETPGGGGYGPPEDRTPKRRPRCGPWATAEHTEAAASSSPDGPSMAGICRGREPNDRPMIGVDVGGTFTDVFILDETQRHRCAVPPRCHPPAARPVEGLCRRHCQQGRRILPTFPRSYTAPRSAPMRCWSARARAPVSSPRTGFATCWKCAAATGRRPGG